MTDVRPPLRILTPEEIQRDREVRANLEAERIRDQYQGEELPMQQYRVIFHNTSDTGVSSFEISAHEIKGSDDAVSDCFVFWRNKTVVAVVPKSGVLYIERLFGDGAQ